MLGTISIIQARGDGSFTIVIIVEIKGESTDSQISNLSKWEIGGGGNVRTGFNKMRSYQEFSF